MQSRTYWPYRSSEPFQLPTTMPSEKSLERSVSSAGLDAPKRESSNTAVATRRRANTGSRTPHMMGLGVPTEKIVTSGRALERRESSQCLGLVVPQGIPLSPASNLESGAVSPAILLTPASSGDDEGSTESSVVSDNSNLSVLREDLPTPPLATLLTDSEDDVSGSAMEDGEAEYTSILIPPSSFIGTRSRRGTMSSQKSVNFDPAPAEVPPVSSSIRVKTVEFSDPDPTFHRAVGSPNTPTDEAHVEQVGAFRVTNLRNDSLGNLPKIVSTTPSSEEATPIEPVEGVGMKFQSDGGADSESQRKPTPPPKPAKVTPRKVSAGSAGSSLRGNPLMKNLITRPPAAIVRGGDDVNTWGHGNSFPSVGTATTAVSNTHAHQEDSVICSTCRLDAALVDIGPLVLEDTAPVEEGESGSMRIKGSLAASIQSVHDILWKDDSAKSTPQGSRRSSAWAIGQGSLGIGIDPLSGGVEGKGDGL